MPEGAPDDSSEPASAPVVDWAIRYLEHLREHPDQLRVLAARAGFAIVPMPRNLLDRVSGAVPWCDDAGPAGAADGAEPVPAAKGVAALEAHSGLCATLAQCASAFEAGDVASAGRLIAADEAAIRERFARLVADTRVRRVVLTGAQDVWAGDDGVVTCSLSGAWQLDDAAAAFRARVAFVRVDGAWRLSAFDAE